MVSDQMNREIVVTVGEVEGGIGISFGDYLGMDPTSHRSFCNGMLRAAGFIPETVRFAPPLGKDSVDWGRLRITSHDCQIHGVRPSLGVQKIRGWFRLDEANCYGISFVVSGPIDSD